MPSLRSRLTKCQKAKVGCKPAKSKVVALTARIKRKDATIKKLRTDLTAVRKRKRPRACKTKVKTVIKRVKVCFTNKQCKAQLKASKAKRSRAAKKSPWQIKVAAERRKHGKALLGKTFVYKSHTYKFGRVDVTQKKASGANGPFQRRSLIVPRR